MNITPIKSYEERAIDTVVAVLNRARESLGERQTLKQLATSRNVLTPPAKVILTSLGCPLAITSEKLIKNTIEKKWRLTDAFKYVVHYMGASQDESSRYYYFEVIFSQPTASYPIPQVTATVLFIVEDKNIDPPEVKGVPTMKFRLEGHRTDYDVRHVLLTPDWILGVLKMKIKFFQRLEEIRLF